MCAAARAYFLDRLDRACICDCLWQRKFGAQCGETPVNTVNSVPKTSDQRHAAQKQNIRRCRRPCKRHAAWIGAGKNINAPRVPSVKTGCPKVQAQSVLEAPSCFSCQYVIKTQKARGLVGDEPGGASLNIGNVRATGLASCGSMKKGVQFSNAGSDCQIISQAKYTRTAK